MTGIRMGTKTSKEVEAADVVIKGHTFKVHVNASVERGQLLFAWYGGEALTYDELTARVYSTLPWAESKH